jgi:hypothetical protein
MDVSTQQSAPHESESFHVRVGAASEIRGFAPLRPGSAELMHKVNGLAGTRCSKSEIDAIDVVITLRATVRRVRVCTVAGQSLCVRAKRCV